MHSYPPSPHPAPREPCWAAGASSLTLSLIGALCLRALVLRGQRSSSILLEGDKILLGRVRRLPGMFKGGRSDGEEGVRLRDSSSWASVRGEHRVQSTSQQGPGRHPCMTCWEVGVVVAVLQPTDFCPSLMGDSQGRRDQVRANEGGGNASCCHSLRGSTEFSSPS